MQRLLFAYTWIILRNLIGWTLLLITPVVGPIPGPGGILTFLIGFGLISFPGKRALTARILRGKPARADTWAYRITETALALLLPGLIAWYLHRRGIISLDGRTLGAYAAGAVVLWLLASISAPLVNRLLRGAAVARRHVRPWLRRRGIDLLPPRRKRRLHRDHRYSPRPNEEILEFHDRYREGMGRAWKLIKPWALRLFRVAFIAAMFALMLRPVWRDWDKPGVRERVLAVNWWQFAIAAVMFSLFLFIFRSLVWRRIMIGMGHRLPVAPAVRIWSMSELARYMPGVIWQVVGRVLLCKPYGISGTVSSASQLLELSIFMLANILLALAGLMAAGIRLIPADHRKWLFIAMAFVPLLLVLIHPRIFYALLNGLLRKLKKPEVTARLPKRVLSMLLGWNILGLLWQSLAIWLLTRSTLGLPIEKWYVLAGAYCLAWTMGFSVGFMAPGGIGVREFVFVSTLQFVLPRSWVDAHIGDALLPAVCGFTGVLLRLWAMAGELSMAATAYIADWKGATNRPDAPGRVSAVEELAERSDND